jgi:cytochrome c oxidase subunit 3
MEIPYTVSARPDTGLYNAKLGVWLFLASEVMLFAGLFSAYVFMRLGAEDGYWPHGLLNVFVGTVNTVILIASSITIVLAWAALKTRQYLRYKAFLGATLLLGAIFLTIKLGYEYPAKFAHFGVFIKKDSIGKYEQYLGNEELKKQGLPPRYEISGHLEALEVTVEGDAKPLQEFAEGHGLEAKGPEGEHHAYKLVNKADEKKGVAPSLAEKVTKIVNPETKLPVVKIAAYEIALDPANADPSKFKYGSPSFFLPTATDTVGLVHAEDSQWANAFVPKHSSFLSIYYLITGLHGLHILGGLIVMAYFFFFGDKLYRHNPEHMANRIEVCGLYWHFVDLVWIFVFPIFYLL